MHQLAHHPLHAATLHAAAVRADGDPTSRLPCPVCGAGLKGANLERHVTEKHPEAYAHQAGGVPVLAGVDRRIRRWLWVAAVVWLGLFAAAVLVAPDQLADSDVRSTEPLTADEVGNALTDVATSPFGLALAGGILLLVVLAVALRANAFRATVTVTHDEVRVRHRAGTGLLRVPLPTTVAVGQLYVRRGGNGDPEKYSGPVTEEAVGVYLRVGDGRRSATIGCSHGTDVRKHWAGLHPGPRRKRWDVTLAPGPFVALQYALADAGVLTARSTAEAGA